MGKISIPTFVITFFFCSYLSGQDSSTPQTATLYERLGGEQGVRKIVNAILDKNLNNPEIGHHFKNSDMAKLKQRVFEFFSMGIGGPHQYTGRDMVTAHTGLNITEREFEIANKDTMEALKENGVGSDEIDEVVAILNSMRGDVIRK